MRKATVFGSPPAQLPALLSLGGILLAAATAAAQTATSFSENFAGPGLNAALQDSTGSYVFNGVATNDTGNRTYISTVAKDFASLNFSALLTYTVPNGEDSAFFGIGSGVGDTNFYSEPLSAVYMRSDPANFGSGDVHVTINNGTSANEGSAFGYPGNGTSRALITETNGIITFSIDPDSSSGTFVAAYSKSINLATQASFLNDDNSSIFFGSSVGTVFDSLDVTVAPEPSTLALSALGGLTAWLGLRRRQ